MPQLRNPAIEGLGEVAGREETPPETAGPHRRRAGGARRRRRHSRHFPAVVEALRRAGEPAAAPALGRLAEDAGNGAVRSRARAALAETFEDPEAIERLHEELDEDPAERRFRAARTLLRVGEPAGYEWARKHLIEDPPGAGDPDFRPPLVQELVDAGGPEARAILEDAVAADTDNEWLQAGAPSA